jgi:2-polyprenyl-6-hydroxyphenyl methylase/3-demethylubiquinone-9 3-methyltransferase
MQFDFGKNWLDFSKNALTSEQVEQAQQDFTKLFHNIELKGKFFVDIGFGQGLSLLIAKQKGATAVGCEINPTVALIIVSQMRKNCSYLPYSVLSLV